MPVPRSALVGSVLLALLLTGCGHENDDDPTARGDRPRESTEPTREPTSTPTSAPTAEPAPAQSPAPAPTDETSVDVTDLPEGRPPLVDVVVDSTLFHDGREIALPVGGARPLGGFEGRTYLSIGTADGDQVVTVADDGALTPVGRPHPFYNHFPQLVRETGHVLVIMQNRNGPGVLWVVDVRTGADVARVRGNDFSSLEPADRALADLWSGSGTVARPEEVLARSADGSHEVAVAGDPYASLLQLTFRATGASTGTTFAFAPRPTNESPVLTEGIVVESDRSFLAVVTLGETASGFEQAVIRCTTDGSCTRVTPVGTDVQVAGTGTDMVLAEPA